MKLLVCFVLAANLLAQHPGWFSEREYENVRLTFEYKLAQWAEAAIVLRTPREGRPIQQGVSIFLAHDFHQKPGLHTTGALAGIKAPNRLLPASFNEWHKVELTLNGDQLRLLHNGEVLQNLTLPRQKLGKGFLHFADLLHKFEVRNFSAVDLGDKARLTTRWEPWQLRDAGTWKSGPDWATGTDGHGILYGGPPLKNFLFAALVRSTNNANGGVFFRGHPDKSRNRGWEVQIYSPLDSVYPTGSIYGLSRSSIASETEGRWFYLQVLVEDQRCTVWVDGVEVAHTSNLPAEPASGQIGLQIHMEKTQVEWKQLRAISF